MRKQGAIVRIRIGRVIVRIERPRAAYRLIGGIVAYIEDAPAGQLARRL